MISFAGMTELSLYLMVVRVGGGGRLMHAYEQDVFYVLKQEILNKLYCYLKLTYQGYGSSELFNHCPDILHNACMACKCEIETILDREYPHILQQVLTKIDNRTPEYFIQVQTMAFLEQILLLQIQRIVANNIVNATGIKLCVDQINQIHWPSHYGDDEFPIKEHVQMAWDEVTPWYQFFLNWLYQCLCWVVDCFVLKPTVDADEQQNQACHSGQIPFSIIH